MNPQLRTITKACAMRIVIITTKIHSLTFEVFSIKHSSNISKPWNNIPYSTSQPRQCVPNPISEPRDFVPGPLTHPHRSVPCLLSQPGHSVPGPISRRHHPTVDSICHCHCAVEKRVPCPYCFGPSPVCCCHCNFLACIVCLRHETRGSGLACSVVQWACSIYGTCFEVVGLKQKVKQKRGISSCWTLVRRVLNDKKMRNKARFRSSHCKTHSKSHYTPFHVWVCCRCYPL